MFNTAFFIFPLNLLGARPYTYLRRPYSIVLSLFAPYFPRGKTLHKFARTMLNTVFSLFSNLFPRGLTSHKFALTIFNTTFLILPHIFTGERPCTNLGGPYSIILSSFSEGKQLAQSCAHHIQYYFFFISPTYLPWGKTEHKLAPTMVNTTFLVFPLQGRDLMQIRAVYI